MYPLADLKRAVVKQLIRVCAKAPVGGVIRVFSDGQKVGKHQRFVEERHGPREIDHQRIRVWGADPKLTGGQRALIDRLGILDSKKQKGVLGTGFGFQRGLPCKDEVCGRHWLTVTPLGVFAQPECGLCGRDFPTLGNGAFKSIVQTHAQAFHHMSQHHAGNGIGGATAVQLWGFFTNDDGNAVGVYVHRSDIGTWCR